MDPKRFGLRLKELRQAAEATQPELAKAAKLSLSTIAQLEQGVKQPSWETVQLLAKALGVRVTAFETPARSAKPAKRGRPKKKK